MKSLVQLVSWRANLVLAAAPAAMPAPSSVREKELASEQTEYSTQQKPDSCLTQAL